MAQHGPFAADASIGGALKPEQVLRIGPALTLFADAKLFRHGDIVEENFVQHMLAINRDDRLHRHAGRINGATDEGNPFLLLPLIGGAR